MPDTRLIVDTDPGTDDAIALLMLLATSERVGIEVETSNQETLGQSILYPGKGNTSVAHDVDTERFFKLFYGALG